MSKRKHAESASITTRAGIARMANQPQGPNGAAIAQDDQPEGYAGLRPTDRRRSIFEDSDLRPHGNVIEKEFTLLEYRYQGGA